MNEQIFDAVLNDMLEELKQSNQSLKDLQTVVKDLQEKTAGFEQKLKDQTVIAPPADTTPLQELTGKAISQIAAIVEAQPKNVVKQYRLSFFPDQDFHGSYKHLIDRITIIAIALAFIYACYSLGIHYMEKHDPAPGDNVSLPATPPAQNQTSPSQTPIPHLPISIPPTRTKPFPRHSKEQMDTLRKKYMRKTPDSTYEFP